MAQVRFQDFGSAVVQYAVSGICPDAPLPPPNIRFRRQDETNAVDQVYAGQLSRFYHHVRAVVGPRAEPVVPPLHNIFMDQLIPPPGDRHSPDKRRRAIRLAGLELAIGHRFP